MPYGPEVYDGSDRNFLKAVAGIASEIGTATASSGAATLNDYYGIITSESLTTAQNAIYTLTLTNDKIAAGDIIMCNVANGTNTQGSPVLGIATPSAGSATIRVHNLHASAQAFNGTIRIQFKIVKAL